MWSWVGKDKGYNHACAVNAVLSLLLKSIGFVLVVRNNVYYFGNTTICLAYMTACDLELSFKSVTTVNVTARL